MFKCVNCGKEYDGAFCPECGTEHAREIVYVTKEDEPKKKIGLKTWLVAIVIAVGLGVLSAPDYSETPEGQTWHVVTPEQNASNTTSTPENTVVETVTVYEDGVAAYELQYVYEEVNTEPVNTVNNPRIIDVVDPNASTPRVATEVPLEESADVYAPVLERNTVLPNLWNDVDYQYSYSGVFARYCELAYSLDQDPGIYQFAEGDINDDGIRELFIQHPAEDFGRNYDVYTINQKYLVPQYVGTIEDIYVLDCNISHAGTEKLVMKNYLSNEEVDVRVYQMKTDPDGVPYLELQEQGICGVNDEQYIKFCESQLVGGWEYHHYGVISDGIKFPPEQ